MCNLGLSSLERANSELRREHLVVRNGLSDFDS